MTLSQTGARATTGARSLLTAANQAAIQEKEKKEKESNSPQVKEKTDSKSSIESLNSDPPKPEDKKPSADQIASKREWCISQMTPNFFATPTPKNTKEPSVEALDQFQNFVNVICPALDLAVPSKFREINRFFIVRICY